MKASARTWEPPLARCLLDPRRAQDRFSVCEYPPPDPFLRDEVLVFSHAPEPDKIQQHFQRRRLYRLRIHQGDSDAFSIEPSSRHCSLLVPVAGRTYNRNIVEPGHRRGGRTNGN